MDKLFKIYITLIISNRFNNKISEDYLLFIICKGLFEKILIINFTSPNFTIIAQILLRLYYNNNHNLYNITKYRLNIVINYCNC